MKPGKAVKKKATAKPVAVRKERRRRALKNDPLAAVPAAAWATPGEMTLRRIDDTLTKLLAQPVGVGGEMAALAAVRAGYLDRGGGDVAQPARPAPPPANMPAETSNRDLLQRARDMTSDLRSRLYILGGELAGENAPTAQASLPTAPGGFNGYLYGMIEDLEAAHKTVSVISLYLGIKV